MPKKRPAKKKTKQPTTRTTGDDSLVRLQKVLASAGYGSRRNCETLITDGRVVVDNETVTELGTKVDPKTNKISVDGSILKPPRLVYYALNKPVGIITTNRDPQGRPRVVDMIESKERVFPVGRLDRSSEGLILLTNDGELTEQLSHPRYGVKKTYLVTVAGTVSPETMKEMKDGIHFTEGKFRVEGARIKKARGKSTELEIVLREGKNREIRRILARLGHKVQQLKRVAVGSVRLGQMPAGAHRTLTPTEIKKLREEIVIAMKSQEGEEPKTRKTARKRPTTVRPGTKRKKKTTAKKSAGRRNDGITIRAPGNIIISTESSGTGTVIGEGPSSDRPTRKKKSPKGRSGSARTGDRRSSKSKPNTKTKAAGKSKTAGKQTAKKSKGRKKR